MHTVGRSYRREVGDDMVAAGINEPLLMRRREGEREFLESSTQ